MSNNKPITHLALEKKQAQERLNCAEGHLEKQATMTAVQQQKKLGETAERASALMLIGQFQAFNAVSKVTQTATVAAWKQAKESKIYQSLGAIPVNGELLTVSTWEGFCKHVIGASRQHVDEQINQLKALGQEAYEALTNMGLGNRERRKLTKAPDDVKDAIQRAAADNDKEALLEIIDDFSAKHAREKEELKREAEGLKKDLAAKQAVLESKVQHIGKLEHQLAERDTMSVDERATELDQRLEVAVLEAIGAMLAPASACKAIFDWKEVPEHLRHKALVSFARLRANLDELAEQVGVPVYVIEEPVAAREFWQNNLRSQEAPTNNDEPPAMPGVDWEDPDTIDLDQ